MGTYTSPYIRGRIQGLGSNTAANRHIQTNRLKDWFVEAGWTAQRVGARLRVHTAGPSAFEFCLLGASQDVFYQVKLSDMAAEYMLATNLDSCCEVCEITSQPYFILDPSGQMLLMGFAHDRASSVSTVLGDDCETPDAPKCSEHGLKIVSIGSQNSAAAIHEGVKNVAGFLLVGRLGISNVTIYETQSDGSGGFYTDFGLVSSVPIDWTVEFGGQLNTTVSIIDGMGYLLQGQPSTLEDNYLQMYMWYETTDSVSVNTSNQIRFVTRVNSRFTDTPTIHPFTIYESENGNNSTVNLKGGLTTVNDIEGFISPMCFFLDQPELGLALNCTAWGGAFRLKNLEAEIGEPNITKAIFMAATLQRISHNRDNFRDTCNAVCNCAYWVESLDAPSKTYGTGIYNIAHTAFTNTRSFTTQRDGIMWYGGNIASVCEPWLGWNPFLDSSELTTPVPIFCQIPDCIIVHRSLNLGLPPDPEDEIFTWDGKLWRYYQVDRYAETGTFDGPGSSMAFRVANSQVYTEGGYEGLEMYELDSMSMDPSSLTAGGTATITITADAGQDLSDGGQCVIRANNQRVQFADHIVTFAPGESTAEVEITENDLGVTETVQIQSIGKDDQIIVLNIVCNA